jgi:hypothetical protein
VSGTAEKQGLSPRSSGVHPSEYPRSASDSPNAPCCHPCPRLLAVSGVRQYATYRSGAAKWRGPADNAAGQKTHRDKTCSGDRRRGLSRITSVRAVAQAGMQGALRRQLLHRSAATSNRYSFEVMRHDLTFPSMSRSTRFTTSPVRPRRSTTSAIPSKPPKRAWSGQSTCWGSPNRYEFASCRRPLAKVYGDRTSIRKPKSR